MLLQFAQQIADHILFVRKILVKAASWNVGRRDDPIDGYIGKARLGQFRPAGGNQTGPLFLRQPVKCRGGHSLPPL